MNQYPVRHAFDYAGRHYAVGSMWTPKGFKNDKLLMQSHVDTTKGKPVEEKPKRDNKKT